jgi:hypothetical protein
MFALKKKNQYRLLRREQTNHVKSSEFMKALSVSCLVWSLTQPAAALADTPVRGEKTRCF